MTDIYPTGYWDGENPEHALSIPLSNWIIEYLQKYKFTPIYDFGCGKGMYLAKLQDAGFKLLCGFEGIIPSNKIFNNIIQQDITNIFNIQMPGVVISLEVAEHIPKEFTNSYLTNIYNSCMTEGIFIASWAIKGQGGRGHCNELDNEDAIKLITDKGFEFLEKDTISVRQTILDIEDIDNGHLPWFKNTILIFRKK